MTADLVCTPPTLRTDQPSREYLTRRQSADYIREELGRPMSFSTASKLGTRRVCRANRVVGAPPTLFTR